MSNSDLENKIIEIILNNNDLLNQIAMRMIKIISSGPSEGNEVIKNIGEFYYTRNQLDRLKKAFIFLAAHDRDFQYTVKRVMTKELSTPKFNSISKSQILQRIEEYGCLTFKYKGKLCGFYAHELYAVFAEFSRPQVLDMLKANDLWIKSVIHKYPKTGKTIRAHILNV